MTQYTHHILLAPGESLQLEWGRGYTNFSIRLNGRLLGTIPDKASLKLGQRFDLDANRYITVILAWHGLELWYAGTDLLSGVKTGTPDPFSNAAMMLIGTGVIFILLGLTIVIEGNITNIISPYPVAVFLAGVAMLALGIWAHKSENSLPVWIAIFLFGLGLPFLLMARRFILMAFMGLFIAALVRGARVGAITSFKPRQMEEEGPLDQGV